MRFALSITILIIITSCKKKENRGFTFSSDEPEILKTEINSFIDSIIIGNKNSCNIYQYNSIKWWNSNFKGAVKLIPTNQSLQKVKELKCLLLDTLEVNGDTIKGLITVRNWMDDIKLNDFNNCFGGDRIDTSYIHLILKDQKLSEIIHYKRQPKKPKRLVVSVQSFYFDESEITSDAYKEYKELTKIELDSIQAKKNNYTLLE